MAPSIVALVPARGGSKRIPKKNIRPLMGHPLLAYTIAAAKEAGIFKTIVVSSEDEDIGKVAFDYGADWHHRDAKCAADDSPDIDWLYSYWFNPSFYEARPDYYDQLCFAILRPTSPFRTADTIRRAWSQWLDYGRYVDSMRAVEPVSQHPGKMWVCDRVGYERQWTMEPFCTFGLTDPPAHSRPTQSLPKVWMQTAALEIAWTKTVTEKHSISGDKIMPFFSEGYEGVDLNTPLDWIVAEALVSQGLAQLPRVEALV